MASSRWRSYSPDPSPDPEGSGEGTVATPAAKPPRARRTRLVAIVAVSLTVAAGGVLLVSSISDNVGDADRPQTVDGFARMIADLEEETGTTEVFEAVLYPDYAVVGVPLRPGDVREVSYRWDGDLTESSKGTSDEVPFDLADVDASVLGGMCEQVRGLVEDAGACYVIVRRPDEDRDEGWLWAYTSNEFSQGGYISFDLAGNEVSRSTW